MKYAASFAVGIAIAVLLCLSTLPSVVTAIGGPRWSELEGYTYDQYLVDFDKPLRHRLQTAAGKKEYLRRSRVFQETLETIRQHNAGGSGKGRGGASLYKMGVNHMTDWLEEERRAVNGGKSSQMANHPQKPKPTRMFSSTGAPLPDAVDLRNRVPSIFSAIKDQMMCGDCWSFASTETMESYQAIATGQLYSLSVGQVTACTPNPDECGGTGGCMGGIAELAYDYAQGGLTQEWEQPFLSGNGTTQECHNNVGTHFIYTDGYVKVPANNQTAVMETLATVGPLAVNVDASNWFTYESGIYDGCSYSNNISIDHVVQLVGYGRDEALSTDYWIIRNSWSPVFGEQGYIRMHRSSNAASPSCGWDVHPQDGTACKGAPPQLHVCGECGILFDTSYPIIKKTTRAPPPASP